ncbi:MAG: efflux RND transporter periplasmic adaptor subunit [Firmicutes bacterium]|nr:efflux RND transporter periplasmic adaptor subunit [Bacillota bacterium]
MNSRRWIVLNVIIVVVLVGLAFGAWYYINNAQNYLSTDNANIDGTPIQVVAPVAGTITKWNATEGKTFNKGDELGEIETQAAGATAAAGGQGRSASAAPATQTVPIEAPQSGTVADNKAVVNTFVAPGTPLATLYDLNHLFVTARIKETVISDVKVGQDVDIYVDAFPGTTLSGKVEEIGYTAASVGSLLPQNNTTGNYQKVTQVIPVRISISDQQGLRIVPGMNVTVRIHR